MELLLIEDGGGEGSLVSDRLSAAGHHLRSCYDEVSASPCRGVRDDAACPLHQSTDLAVVVRRDAEPDGLFEVGALCAERHRIPVVRVAPDVTAERLLETVRAAAAAGKDRIEARYASVVRDALGSTGATVEANRLQSGVRIRIGAPASLPHTERAAIADRARATVRSFDPFVRTIDVAVVPMHERGKR